MTGRRIQDIWKQQREAARGVRERHGEVSALVRQIGADITRFWGAKAHAAVTSARRPTR